MQDSRKSSTDLSNTSIGIYWNGELIDSIESGFVSGEKSGNILMLPTGDLVEYLENKEKGICYLVLVEDEEEEDEEKMKELEEDYNSESKKPNPLHPDTWFPAARDCRDCKGFALAGTSLCGCKDKILIMLGEKLVPSDSSDSSGSPQKDCPYGKKCRYLNTARGCRDFHPESDKSVPASTGSKTPKRCSNGANCSYLKTTRGCHYFHPKEEIPFCSFGKRCNKGEKCCFRH